MRPFVLAVVCLTGCEATILKPGEVIGGNTGGNGGSGAGAGGGSVEVNPCSSEVSVGLAPMRRLSHEEYRYSISDLQPTWSATVATQAGTLTPDSESLGFRNSSLFLDVKPVLAQQYMDAAEQVAALAVTNLTALLPCSPTPAANEAACAEQFVRTFGRKLYRHPLSTEEVERYKTVYAAARTGGYDFKTGIEWVVFSFLQSPGFLYRVELDAAGTSGVRAVTPIELASRLSYLIWQSGPDETLLAAAEAGQLTTRADLDVQARRMLDDPKARRLVGFFEQWLKWEKLDGLSRDATKFPGLPASLGPMMHNEVRLFTENAVFEGDHTLKTLLTGNFSYVNQALAQHYGIAGVTGTAFQRVTTTGRGGLMLLGGNMALHDLNSRTSIVHRGVAVRTSVMCQVVPAAPPDIPALGPIDATLSQAQRLEMHRANPTCAGCHDLIDPLGVTFEGFDAVGRARTEDEAGHAIDTRGALTRSKDLELNGPVADANELMGRFGQSDEVRDCFATQVYRFSAGRKEETADACSTYTMKKRFEASGGDIKDLILTLTQLDDFDHRQVTQ